jgi:muscarinic acetylcholine receptor M3
VIVISVVAGIMSLVIITGNLLIIIAYGINKKLRVMNNYFLVSLSIADFLIGLLSIPSYTTYVLLGNWTGTLGCDIWLVWHQCINITIYAIIYKIVVHGC